MLSADVALQRWALAFTPNQKRLQSPSVLLVNFDQRLDDNKVVRGGFYNAKVVLVRLVSVERYGAPS
jgi:hypothetical protein